MREGRGDTRHQEEQEKPSVLKGKSEGVHKRKLE